MKPNTLDEILVENGFFCVTEVACNKTLKLKNEILELVSKAIQMNRHGFGLTVAEGKQLARRVKVALL